jgi:hypothetical protein
MPTIERRIERPETFKDHPVRDSEGKGIVIGSA